ncbi:immunoglobulin-binding regulator [Escherichia coli]|nr:immunoglobulin-binding regulator [Escherichia coli]
MSIYKIPLPLNILEAARERITWTLNTLPRVCVSFSGGKDSGGNDSNLLIVFYVQIMPDDFVMQLHRF